MRVAEPAIAAAQQHGALPGLSQIGQHGFLVVVEDLGPYRHAQHEVAALGAGLVGAGPATAFLGAEMLLIAVIDQRVQILGRLEDDVAALAAIAAIRPAEFDELLAAKAHGAAPAVTALQVDLALVEKFHRPQKNKKGEGTGRSPRVPSVGERLFGSLRRSAISAFGLNRNV